MKKNFKQIIVIMSLTMLVTLNSSVLMTNTYATTVSAGKVDAVSSATTKPPVTPLAPVSKPAPAKVLLNDVNMQNVIYIEGYNDFKLVLDDQLNVLSIKQLNQPVMTFETLTNKPLYHVLEMLKSEIGYTNASFKANPFIIVGYGVALDKNTSLDLIKQTFAHKFKEDGIVGLSLNNDETQSTNNFGPSYMNYILKSNLDSIFAPEVFSYEAYLNMITNETKMSKLGDTYSNLDYKVKSSLVFDEATVPTILTITSVPIVETAITPSHQKNDDERDGDHDDDENENHEDFDVDVDEDDDEEDDDDDDDDHDNQDEDDDLDEDNDYDDEDDDHDED